MKIEAPRENRRSIKNEKTCNSLTLSDDGAAAFGLGLSFLRGVGSRGCMPRQRRARRADFHHASTITLVPREACVYNPALPCVAS